MPLTNPQVRVLDEGINATSIDNINFTGAGVTATSTGGVATVTIPGGGGGATPGGSGTQVQYKNGTSFAGATNLSIDTDGTMIVADVASPTTPSTGFVKVYSTNVGGREMLSQLDPTGIGTQIQPSFARNKIGMWMPAGTSSTITSLGLPAPTGVGAVVNTSASTSFLTSLRRASFTSATGLTGQLTSLRGTVQQFWLGNAAGLGGFHTVFRFSVTDTTINSAARMFVGLRASVAAPTNIEPNATGNNAIIGICKLSTSNNFASIGGTGSATATTVDLGTNYPATTIGADVYELAMYASPNATSVAYTFKRLNTAFSTSGTFATAILPSTTTFLAPVLWRTNNSATTPVGFDLINFYIETIY